MKKLLLISLSALVFLPACENGTRAPLVQPIAVTLSPSTVPGIDQGQTIPITAMVSNDSSNKGVTWAVSLTMNGPSCAPTCGSISPSTSLSAMPTTYMAPGTTSDQTPTVFITATSAADTTKSASVMFMVHQRPAGPPPNMPASPPMQPTIGTIYSLDLKPFLTGGTPPFHNWIVCSTSAACPGVPPAALSPLPNGLNLNPDTGVISGIPLITKRSGLNARLSAPAPSDPLVTIRTIDSSGGGGLPTTVTVSFAVTPAPPLVITTASPLPTGTVGIAYSAPVAAMGGVPFPGPSYHWSASGLPAPLAIDMNTGLITGMPTGAVTGATVMITVTDAQVSTPTSTTKSFTITINPPPPLMITTASPLPNGVVNTPYSAPVAATGGLPPYHWSQMGLPAGLSINMSTGQITGTPTALATNQAVTITVTDSETPAASTPKAFTITISPPPLTITAPSTLPNGFVNNPYPATTAMATGGVTPYHWSAMNLPTGLAIDPMSGVISGTPTVTVTNQNVTITVTDSETPTPMTASTMLSITITTIQALAIITTALPNGVVGTAYSFTVVATGGVQPYHWSATGLPAPLVINPSTGQITGTPAAAVTNVSVTITVTDSETPTPMSVSKTLTLTINAACTPGQTTLCGRFTWYFQGNNAMGAVAMAGSILTDGTNVLSGVMDVNRTGSVITRATVQASPASHFSFDTQRLGTLTLNAIAGPFSSVTVTFAVVMAPDGTAGRLIGFDPAGTSGILGSGALGIPDSTAFNLGAIHGNYGLAITGGDSLAKRAGMIAVFGDDGMGNCTTGTNGSVTINVGGTFATGLNFTGSCFPPDANTGRASGVLIFTGAGNPFTSPLHFSVYVFNATKLLFMGTDPLDSGHPILSGFADAQPPGTFNNGSITCGIGTVLPCVFAALGSTDGTLLLTGASSAAIGLVTVNSQNPPMMTFTLDVNEGGTLVPNMTIPNFTYNIQPAGYGTITPPPNQLLRGNIDFVVIGPNKAFFLAEDTDVHTGLLEPQLATALNIGSTPREFAAVTQPPPVLSYGTAVAFATLTAGSGSGTATGVADANGGTPVSDAMFTASYMFDTPQTGRFTGTTTLPGVATFTGIVLKGGRFVVIGQDVGHTAVIIEFGRSGGDILP